MQRVCSGGVKICKQQRKNQLFIGLNQVRKILTHIRKAQQVTTLCRRQITTSMFYKPLGELISCSLADKGTLWTTSASGARPVDAEGDGGGVVNSSLSGSGDSKPCD